uniref:Spindle and kinetochore associated complex subunit 3 n=1 Tax=Dicentrarchus labrax TaxID=13489 RepID=A0A8C4EST8_DICLA
MDPTRQFFSKLRKLAVTLESQTDQLQQTFETRDHQQAHGSKAKENEVSSFIKACRVMEHRVTEDIQTLRAHWEKYGYRAPRDTQRPTSKCTQNVQESDAEDEVADESAGGEAGSQEEAEGNHSSSPLKAGPPSFADVLRTPQLSDFGLSEMQLKRTLAGAEWCSEVPPMPEMSLPLPSLSTPAPPPMPITPKCALRMDDDELQTPQMHDFGISEHTMCLNNDFTMDLLQKNVENELTNGEFADNLESPEPPVFCTPGFKIKKTNGQCSPPAQGNDDPESPGRPGNLPTTPEVPAFQTPYMNRLVSNKKDSHTFQLPTSPHNGATGSKRAWEYDVPEISILGVEDKQIPEMPNLESVLGNSLQSKKTSEHEKVTKLELTVSSLELDGPTQEFSLGTPRIRTDFQEFNTPEMPDLSSVTQDICKVDLSNCQYLH